MSLNNENNIENNMETKKTLSFSLKIPQKGISTNWKASTKGLRRSLPCA